MKDRTKRNLYSVMIAAGIVGVSCTTGYLIGQLGVALARKLCDHLEDHRKPSITSADSK